MSEYNDINRENPNFGAENSNPQPQTEPENAPEAAAEAQAPEQPSYQSGVYSYGRYGSEPIPEATRSGSYTQPDQPRNQNGYYAPQGQSAQNSYYTQPAQNGYYTQSADNSGYYTGTTPAPQKPKKEKKPMSNGARTALTAAISVLATTALLLCILWGLGMFNNPGTPVAEAPNGQSGKPEVGESLPAESSDSSRSDESAPDAFSIQPIVGKEETVTADGTLTPKQVAAKVSPSVVCVQNYYDVQSQQLQGEGSGIIFNEEGYIITNAHVVDGASSLKVVLMDGSEHDAYLVGADSTDDIAVIRINAKAEGLELTAADFGDSDLLAQGDYVMVLGNPGGLAFSNSVTMGIVSATGRQITDENGMNHTVIQTDATINPGNSGGPLVNMYGQVVGIASSKIVATGYEGLCFAIPITDVQSKISDLKEFGYVRNRAYLGISYQFIDEAISRMYGLPVGVYIHDFTTDTMSKVGIEEGDILTHADGVELTASSVLVSLLAEKAPGDTMTFTVYRRSEDKTYEFTVVLGEYTPDIDNFNLIN